MIKTGSIIGALALLALGGCSTMGDLAAFAHYNPANYQGCVAAAYEPAASTTAPGNTNAGAPGKLFRLTVIDCKNEQNQGFTLDLATQKLVYNANGVNGSVAAGIRGVVESNMSANAAAVTPAITSAVGSLVAAGLGVPIPPAVASPSTAGVPKALTAQPVPSGASATSIPGAAATSAVPPPAASAAAAAAPASAASGSSSVTPAVP